MESVKIYLSGGMTGLIYEEHWKWRNDIINRIKYGDKRKTPLFFSSPEYYSPSFKNPLHKSEREVFEFELNNLRKSDVVIVNFNVSESIGTAMEIMVAKEHNIPVIGINENKCNLHPWLELCVTRMCDSVEEAVGHIIDFYLK